MTSLDDGDATQAARQRNV